MERRLLSKFRRQVGIPYGGCAQTQNEEEGGWQVGGTVEATKLAVERDGAVNIGGGFHHCCAYAGGGFCAYADISMAVHFGFGRLGLQR